MKRTIVKSSIPFTLALGLLLAVLALTGARAVAAPRAITPIYDIQYTTDAGDGTYPSPKLNEVVTTTGVVYATYAGKGFCIADDAGPWHGLYVYYPSGTMPQVGDEVQVKGTVQEYYGLTELGDYASYTVLSSGNPVYTTSVVSADQIPYGSAATSERYEGVFVELQHITVTAGNDTHNIWTFTDASGGSGKADDWGYDADPAVDDVFVLLRGALFYDWDEYKVMPRDAGDAQLLDSTPPTVSATDPLDGATGVNPYKPVYATFSEAISPTTVSTLTFLVTAPGGGIVGDVTYDGATRQATFTPGSALAFNSLHTATLTTGVQDTSGNPLAADHTWNFDTGAQDTTSPTVVARFPAPEAISVPLNADVVITFSEALDPDTVVAANFELAGAYGALPWGDVSYDEADDRVTLTPNGLLLPTNRYTVTIAAGVADWAGHPVDETERAWSFTTQSEPPMFAFHGDLHNHTAYSDGSLTPADAFSSAVQCGLDFMAVTDHSYAINDSEWADILTQADAATVDGQFVGLRGFEYTQGAEGHTNVYNSVRHATRSDTGEAYADYTPNLEPGVTVQGFYPWLAVTGTQAVDGAGTLMQFNHPGWINFNDWTYHPELSHVALLEEVGNGWGTSYVFSWDEWLRSLDYGWQLGATNNSDNHSTDWGCITPHRTGVVMAELTKADLMDALRARRTFASEDSNYELFFKANGYWMGSEIPNSGQVVLQVQGSDPDGEPTSLVQLYTAHGQVLTQTQPGAADFDWDFTLNVAPGAHYFFILAVQEDGDRVVSSPIWLAGDEDIRITDLSIQPTIPTIYNPSILTARVSNRGQSTQSITVTLSAGGVPIGEVPLTVGACATGPCDDGYANVAWQPVATGPVLVTATLAGAPATDNPEDNSQALSLEVTDEKVPLVLIDAGHNNVGGAPRDARMFADDMTGHGYNVLFNLDEITAGDLNTETVKLLVINAYGPDPLTATETQAIADFVAAGGGLWLNGMSDYTGKVAWANTVADRMNALVGAIETTTGYTVPMRLNDDEILDGNDNNGYPWGILWHLFPVSNTTGVGVNVVRIQSWSDCSLVDREGSALTAGDLGANGFLFVSGDLEAGSGLWGYPNRTHNEDADGEGDAYLYPDTVPLAAAAGYDIPGPAGRIFLYGDANDPFNIFAYVAGDGKQNELFNLEVVMWLLGAPLQKSTVAQARADAELNNTPDHLEELVWVEGTLSAAFGEFFNVLYVQDETGGVTVHAPAGDIDAAQYARGTQVRVVGTVGIYNGDTEIEFFEAEQVQVLTPTTGVDPAPIPMSTYSASLERNEGWLVQITGTVVSKLSDAAIVVDDGSGPVRAFLDGYNGDFGDVEARRVVSLRGLVSEDGDGRRIRLRNHGMHATRPDDVTLLGWAADLSVSKTVTPTVGVPLGSVVTYTIVLSNSGGGGAPGVVLTDVLPAGVDFGGWLEQGSASRPDPPGDTLTWGPYTVPVDEDYTLRFSATVTTNAAYAGTAISNTVTFTSANAGGGSDVITFTVAGGPSPVPSLSITKTVETARTPAHLGDPLTYTVVVANVGGADAGGVAITDVLPAGVVGADLGWTGVLTAHARLTFTLPARVSTDTAYYGATIVNTATFGYAGGQGADGAGFTVRDVYRVYLPLVVRER